MEQATCSRCGKEKPLTEFSPDRRRTNGRQSHCKPCKASAMRQSYPERRDHVQATNRAWAKTNPGKRRAIANRWDRNHPERGRRELERNPEKVRARKRRWAAANKAALAEKQRRRQARIKGSRSRRLTVSEIEQRRRYWGDRCWICQGTADEMDHVKPVAKGGAHLLCNLRPICGDCNKRKGAQWPLPSWCRTAPAARIGSGRSPTSEAA